MKSTVNMHMNKGDVSELHNARDEDLIVGENIKNKETFIDIHNEYGQSFHEIIYKCSLRDKYEELFGAAIAEYNRKQKRKDRVITVDDYMHSVEMDTRGRRQTKLKNGKKIPDTSKTPGKRLSYEVTVNVGNTEPERDEENDIIYDDSNHEVMPECLPRELQLEIVKKYCLTFASRNPNFAVVNINIHGDELHINHREEWEYGAIHSHIEFIPIAEGYKQGLSTQNSMNKALAAMGIEYKKEGGGIYNVWCEKEREYLEKITHEMYEEYCNEHPDFYEKNGPLQIYHPVKERAKMGGLDKENYIAKIALEEKEAVVRAEEAKNQQDKAQLNAEKDAFEMECRSNKIGLNAEAEKNRMDAKKNADKAQELKQKEDMLQNMERLLKEMSDELDKERNETERIKAKNKEDFQIIEKLKIEYSHKLKIIENKKEQMQEMIKSIKSAKKREEVQGQLESIGTERHKPTENKKQIGLDDCDF